MKKYYEFRKYKDIPQWFKDLLFKLGWRRITDTAKPEYVDLINGRLVYVTKDGKLKERRSGLNGSGYSTTKLKQKDGSYKSFKTHVLVKRYIPNPDKKPKGNHIDHDRANNSISNIEHVTAKENSNK